MNNVLECFKQERGCLLPNRTQVITSFNKLLFIFKYFLTLFCLQSWLGLSIACPSSGHWIPWREKETHKQRNCQGLPETGVRNYHLWLVDLLAVPSFRLRMSLRIGSDLLRGPSGLRCYKIFLKAKKQQSWKSISSLVRATSKNHQRQWAVLFALWGSQGERYDSFPLRICSCNLNTMCKLQVRRSWQ